MVKLSRMELRVPQVIKDGLQREAAVKNLSLNAYCVFLFRNRKAGRRRIQRKVKND